MRLINIFRKRDPEERAMKYAFDHGFKAGKNFQYNSGYPIDWNWPWLISVGNNVTLASGVKILAHDASSAKAGVKTKVGIVDIGDNVFVGANTIILPNVRIGDNVIIGAGSVVTHDIPSNNVYAGNPAKRISSFDDFKSKHNENKSKHPIINKYKWKDWPNASQEEWNEMRRQLKDTYGYLG